MERVVTKLTLMIEDAIPEGVRRLELTAGGYMAALDMASGLGVAEEKRDYTVGWNIDGSYAGKTGLKLTLYSFCGEDEFTMSLLVVAKDGNGTIVADRSAEGVPVLKNRCTLARGRIISVNGSVSFS